MTQIRLVFRCSIQMFTVFGSKIIFFKVLSNIWIYRLIKWNKNIRFFSYIHMNSYEFIWLLFHNCNCCYEFIWNFMKEWFQNDTIAFLWILFFQEDKNFIFKKLLFIYLFAFFNILFWYFMTWHDFGAEPNFWEFTF